MQFPWFQNWCSERHALEEGTVVYLRGKKREIEKQMRCRGTRVCFSVSFQFRRFLVHSWRERSLAQVMVQGCGVLGGQEEASLTGQQRGL